jgi:hypothetical protein
MIRIDKWSSMLDVNIKVVLNDVAAVQEGSVASAHPEADPTHDRVSSRVVWCCQ